MFDSIARQATPPISPRKQNEILAFTEREQIDLSEILSHYEKTLDDLNCERSREEVWSGSEPHSPDDFRGAQSQDTNGQCFPGDQLGQIDRLSPRSKKMIASGTNSGRRLHSHPEISRTLSVRERARLRAFRDNHAFGDPTARQLTQIGNAVPLALTARLGPSLAYSVFGVD